MRLRWLALSHWLLLLQLLRLVRHWALRWPPLLLLLRLMPWLPSRRYLLYGVGITPLRALLLLLGRQKIPLRSARR